MTVLGAARPPPCLLGWLCAVLPVRNTAGQKLLFLGNHLGSHQAGAQHPCSPPPPAQAQQKAQGRVLRHCPSQGKGPNPPKQLFCKDRRSSKSPELAAGRRQPASSKQRQPILPPGEDTYFLQPGTRQGPGPGGSSGWAFSAVRSAGSVASALSRGLTVNLLG